MVDDRHQACCRSPTHNRIACAVRAAFDHARLVRAVPFLDLPLPPSRTRTKVACAAQAKSLHADPTSAAALCATGLSDSTRKSHSSAGGSRSSQETTDSARDLLNIALGGPQSRDSLFGFGDVDLSDR